MAVKIRLARHGSKKKPFYRVVVTDEENKRDGRFIEILGVYSPLEQNKKLNLKSDRIQHWVKQGAQMSETVASLVKQSSKVQPVA